MGGFNSTGGGKAVSVHMQTPLPKGENSRAASFNFDFTGGTVNITVSLNAIDYGVSFFQTVFIDNSNNPAAVSINPTGTNQKIVCPPFSQGYFPILTVGPTLSFVASSAGNIVVPFTLLNIFIDMMLWSIGLPGAIAGSVNVNGTVLTQPVVGAYTKRNGSIAVAGVSQLLMPANGGRRRFVIQNPSTVAGQNIAAAESLFIQFSSAAGINDGMSFELLVGQSFDTGAGPVSSEIININAVTIGHRFSSWEM